MNLPILFAVLSLLLSTQVNAGKLSTDSRRSVAVGHEYKADSHVVKLTLQNPTTSPTTAGYVTFGHVFVLGALRPNDSLVARVGNTTIYVQTDVKATHRDGSIRHAVLTLRAPSIAPGSSITIELRKGTTSPPSRAAPDISRLVASAYDVAITFNFHLAEGKSSTEQISSAAILAAALKEGNVHTWLSGEAVKEYDVWTTAHNGKLKVKFHIRAYADGSTTTDVVFDNSWFFSPGKSDLNYDVLIKFGEREEYRAAGIRQYLYSMWHREISSVRKANPHIQFDYSYMRDVGAVMAYDTTYGVRQSAIEKNRRGLNPTNTGPMGTAGVTTYMPTPGGRQDIGPQPNWTAQWLLSQNASAYQVMMANADAAGGIPWHFTDESTGKPINGQTYPNIGYGTNLVNGATTDGANPWGPDTAHQPDLSYLPYLVTGSHYQLENLQAQADYSIYSVLGYGTTTDYNPSTGTHGTVRTGFLGSFTNDNVSNGNQVRGMAWELRQVAEAAYITPDSDPLKSYFVDELKIALKGLVQQYIVDDINGQYGELNGFVQGSTGSVGAVIPWQQDFLMISLGEVAGMNIEGASDDAVTMIKYMDNFVAGLFTSGSKGYNPLAGTPYVLNVNANRTGAAYTTWYDLYHAPDDLNPTWQEGVGGVPADPSVNPGYLINYATQTYGGYGAIAKAALAVDITYTQSPKAIEAYAFVVSEIAYAFKVTGVDETAAYQDYPQFNLVPKLPDGVYLENSQVQVDTSGASTVSLTAKGGDSLLAVVGHGTATLTGGTGTSDILYGGSGTTTLKAGTGNDYMFGYAGATTFVDNIGNNYMKGSVYNGTGTNTYVFTENNSGHDTIANFNISTDKIQIGSNLNGNGVTTASQLINTATTSDGNTVLHLSSNNDITLLGITTPSSLLNNILVS